VNLFRRLKERVARRGRRAVAAPAAPAGPAALFDFADPGATHDPFPAFEALRRDGEVHFLPRHGHWIVLGHASVKEALGRPDVFSSSSQEQVDAVLLGADPPRHEAARRLVASVLTGAAFAQVADHARGEAASLVRPQFDLVADFAVPLARGAAAKLVGLDRHELDAVLGAPDISLPAAEMTPASQALLARSGLFAALAAAGGEGIDEAAAASLVRLLCRAATETTERLIVRAGAAWLGDAAMRTRIGTDAAAMAAFIEEVARLYPPEPNVVRRTTGAAHLAGVEIPAGAHVFLSILAANRDPARFEEPGRLRLDRGRNAHLAFSGGPHHCIGAGLARQIVAGALGCLARSGVRALGSAAAADMAVVQGIATPRRFMVGR
jgi:cytochrome P450